MGSYTETLNSGMKFERRGKRLGLGMWVYFPVDIGTQRKRNLKAPEGVLSFESMRQTLLGVGASVFHSEKTS